MNRAAKPNLTLCEVFMSEPKKNPHAQALGSLGGLRATLKQKAAARRNGRLGGRPKLTDEERASQERLRRDPWYKVKGEK